MDTILGFIEQGGQLICPTCGQVVERGIISLSSHWTSCTGKEFHQAMMKLKDEEITIENIKALGDKYLKDKI